MNSRLAIITLLGMSSICYAADPEIETLKKVVALQQAKLTQLEINANKAVPLGGMVAVMPTTQESDAWQPPAHGQIKDGFMRADGWIVTPENVAEGCRFRVGTALPNMVSKYPKGSTTSGLTGGANLVTLTASNIPQLSGNFSSGPNNAGHAHTWSTSNTGAHSHSFHFYTPHGFTVSPDDQRYMVLTTNAATGSASPDQSDGTHSHSGGTSVESNSHAHSTPVSLGSSFPQPTSNEPAYTEVVWVIRVK